MLCHHLGLRWIYQTLSVICLRMNIKIAGHIIYLDNDKQIYPYDQ